MKSSKTLLYSSAGVALVFVALFGLNLIFSRARVRSDFTADGLHTLSPGTVKILEKVKALDTDISVNLYVSQKGNSLPSYVEPLARNTEDLLNEFSARSGGRLVVKKLDPEPDSEIEDAAKLDGIEPIQSQTGGYYLGVVVNLDPAKATLPAITPETDRLLEYNLARAISQVMQTNKAVIGVLSSLPVMGGPSMNPMAARMGRPQQSEPWIIISQLKQDFDVQNVPMETESIDDKIKVLFIIHPKDISEKAQYAVDQFIMRGGRVVALLDPNCRADERGANNQMGINFGSASTMPKLLKAWGLEFDTSKIVADREFTRELATQRGQRPAPAPAYVWLNKKGINSEDALFSQTDNVLMPFVGAITGKPVDGLKMESILKTTTDSQLVDGMTADFNGAKTMDDFTPSGVVYNLAVRLTGKFKTAFPEGKPGGDTNAPAGLKESGEATVYLFGDADFCFNPFCVQIDQIFRTAIPFNGNLAMMQNVVEQMAGDANLIGSRSRASIRRPFTKIQEMQAAANKNFQSEIGKFQKQVEEAQKRVSEIQSKKEGNQKFILAPESAVELKKVQEVQVQANRDLRRVRRELTKDIDSMENRYKWINIALMPVLVSVAGIVLAISRRSKTAAK